MKRGAETGVALRFVPRMRNQAKESRTPPSPLRLTLFFLFPFLVTLLILLLLLVMWEKKTIENDHLSDLRDTARAFFDQIIVARAWNASHGGVYAEVSPKTPPNPYLDDPERDMLSVAGKRYTKINPAYMTRQMSEIAKVTGGYRFSVVSLRPLNPSNAPDAWEREALAAFEQSGISEASRLEKDPKGIRIFRYIRTLTVEDACLRCHGHQGYQQGDVRGGISIVIPTASHDALMESKVQRSALSLSVTAAASFLFIGIVTFSLSRRLSAEIKKNIEQGKLAAAVELAGATAHEMRQPMTVILHLISLFREKTAHNEPLSQEEMKIVEDQCVRMNETIRKMVRITNYETKSYPGGKKILDLEKSSGEKPEG